MDYDDDDIFNGSFDEIFDDYFNESEPDMLDIFNEKPQIDENLKFESKIEFESIIKECGVEKTKQYLKNRKSILDGYNLTLDYGFIPLPPNVEYDKSIFKLLKNLFFEFFPKCKTIYKINERRYTFNNPKSSNDYSEEYDVEGNLLINYGLFTYHIKQYYQNYEKEKYTLLDFNIFYSFIKYIYFTTYRVRIKDYFIQITPFKRDVLCEVDILAKLRSKLTKNVVYVLNLYYNNRTDLSYLKNLENFKILGYIYIEYTNIKKKKKLYGNL